MSEAQEVVDALPWDKEIQDSRDLKRILQIPRRTWTPEAALDLAAKMTPLLAKEGGTQALRPVQAVALHDLGIERGLICTARVGAGKTLITLLAGYMVESLRTLILVPASLKEKTLRDMRKYREHWEISTGFVRVESYTWLSRKGQVKFLDEYRPELIVCDEAHYLKNTGAAVVKRIRRYLQDIRPQTTLALLSGSLTNRSLKEYWHLLRWTLKHDRCPLPHDYNELDDWASAIDQGVEEMERPKVGALIQLFNDAEKDLLDAKPVRALRHAYRRRLTETPGIVTTEDSYLGASISISDICENLPKRIVQAIEKLEDWETLDGWPIADAMAKTRHQKEHALGFYYRWNPRPLKDWLAPRKIWCATVRKILSGNHRQLDTEEQVRDEFLKGKYPEYREIFEEWEKVKDTFKPKHEAVWIDDFAVDRAAKWAKETPGIVWTFHRAFGERLAMKTGMPFYVNGGLDAAGNFIEDHPPGKSFIASMHANREGKNLQRIHFRNLLTHPPMTGSWWEQLLGRTHREEQPSKEVFAEMFNFVPAHFAAFQRARADAEYVEESTGQSQKVLLATVRLRDPSISAAA